MSNFTTALLTIGSAALRVWGQTPTRQGDASIFSYSQNGYLSQHRPIATIDKPAEVINLVDEAETLNDGFFVPFWCPGDQTQWPRPCFLIDQPSFIHNGGANFLYVDGHAKWHNKQAMIDPQQVVLRYYWATPPPTLNSFYARCGQF